jgi:hypothetical protein
MSLIYFLEGYNRVPMLLPSLSSPMARALRLHSAHFDLKLTRFRFTMLTIALRDPPPPTL